jgi:hypothetical protein
VCSARKSAGQKLAKGTPEARARASAAGKKRYENPEERARTSAAVKLACATPEYRARKSTATKKQFENPEARARMSAAVKIARLKKLHADPVFKAANAERMRKISNNYWSQRWLNDQCALYQSWREQNVCNA